MAVTEAMMLGLPALVTNYASAAEQVRQGVDGLIVENSQQGVTEGLCRLVAQPEEVQRMGRAAAAHDYGNEGDVARLYALLDEIRRERGDG